MAPREHIHFVTGRLAAANLQRVVQALADQVGFDWSIDVLPITVAALMTPAWITSRVQVPAGATQIMLPGYCQGDLSELQERTGLPVQLGPRDLHALPDHFGQQQQARAGYGRYQIEILAEINHAPRLSLDEIVRQAHALARQGADIIDVGCDPGQTWSRVAQCVAALRGEGLRVSIDSFNPTEIEAAVRAGAELVLSVNASNRQGAADWGCEVVVIPDDVPTLGGLEETIDHLQSAGVPFRLDPVLEPLGCGFAASLQRYLTVRQRYPEAAMMMGIGNLTELTDVDSAGINVLLLGFCEELNIHSVLTTQVINWARTSVRECDLARRLVHYAVQQQTLPKHVEPDLVLLRDPKLYPPSQEELEQLANSIRDRNYRIFAADGQLHLISAQLHLTDDNAFRLFERLLQTSPRNLDMSHAFYLGYELAKATTALTLGKQYRQDEALRWGFLTVPEQSHRVVLPAEQKPPTSPKQRKSR